MRRNRGNAVLWLLCLMPLWLGAQTTYRWSATQSATTAAVHEAVVVEYSCRFDTQAYEYIIKFDPPRETSDYQLVLERADGRITDGKRISTYRFVLFPKRAGPLELHFTASMEHTSKASIENTVIGRDNVEKIDFTAKTVALPTVSVAVKGHDAPYAGHVRLDAEVDARNVDAYTPVQVRIRLEGYGNLDRVEPFVFDIPGVKLFGDEPQKALTLGEKGYMGTITQQFAVVSAGDFVVPAVTFRYYDTETGQVQALKTPPVSVRVNAAAVPEKRADEAATETAKRSGDGISWLHLLLALAAGVVIGRFLLPVRVEAGERLPLPERLKQCKDPAKFAAYLTLYDADAYREIIDAIEERLARGEKVDLSVYKRQL